MEALSFRKRLNLTQYLANPTDANQQAAVGAAGELASAEGEMNVYDFLPGLP